MGPLDPTTIGPDGTTTMVPLDPTTMGPDGTTTMGPDDTTTVDPSNDDLYKPNILTSSFKIKDAFDSFNETIQIKYYEKVSLSISQIPAGVVIDTKGSFDNSTLITTFQIHGKNYNKSIGTYHKESDIIFDIIFENDLSLGPNKIPIEMERRSILNIILLSSEWFLFTISFILFITAFVELFKKKVDNKVMKSIISCLFIFIVFSIIPFALSTKYTMNNMGILGLSLCFVLFICWSVIIAEFMKKQEKKTNPIRPNPMTNYRGGQNITYQSGSNTIPIQENLAYKGQGLGPKKSSLSDSKKYTGSAVPLSQFRNNPTTAFTNWRTIMGRTFGRKK